ncbi:MAG: hypothetical protein R3C56_33570 [Pirellulaceae bacterium]
MFLATSDDSGQTFGGAEKLGIGSWKLNACPMDGGELAVAADGSPLTVWRRNQQVFATDVGGRMREGLLGLENNLNRSEWQWSLSGVGQSARRRLNALCTGSNTPIRLSESAADPVISAPKSINGPVVLVWESGKKPDTSIMASVVSD